MWYGEIWSEADMTQLSLMLYFSKTEKYNIKLSCVMSASDQISPYHIFISRYVCMNASLSNQRGYMAAQAHLNGNIIYYVQRKYCEKISSRFWKI